jgi:hypothetical protein
MAKKGLTIFQRLGQILGPDGVKQKQQVTQTQRYNIGSEVLLKTDNKKEYETAKLQAQQGKYLSQVWKKVEHGLFQQAMNYETTRIASYADFEAMEYFPEIAAATDIFAEESCTLNNNGRMVNVYSDSPRIKGIIEDLLFNRLDIHTSLPMWTRNTVRLGDNFVFLNISDTNGIVGAKQMPNYEMERREGDLFEMLTQRTDDDNKSDKTKFYWRGRDVEFNSWQIAHFRILGDDRRLPYGCSVLEKARRIWKLLLMAEDAMLVYRVQRAPERRVFKIYVGNIDEQDVGSYIDEIANRFKRTPMIDPQTGQLDLKYNQLGIDMDIFLPVRSEDAPNPIDTLPGASNLSDIEDIAYLQRKLFTALRVPKPFLGFDETTGDGKNLALQDIRFSRTVNKIQQAMLQELNKIVIIHLYLLGFEEDLDNFTLTLNNPSTQAEMLKVEHLQLKMTLFKDAVSDLGNGFGAMSMTRAKREILGWADDEIKQDLLEQRIEKAASAELANSANVIKHTGLFDNVDRIYGDMKLALKGGGAPPDENGENGGAPSGGGGGGGSIGGGGFGGGGISPDDLDFGEDGDKNKENSEPATGNDDNLGGTTPPPTDSTEPTPPNQTDQLTESINRIEKLLSEKKTELNKKLETRTNKYKGRFFNQMIEMVQPTNNKVDSVKITDKSMKINETVNSMINDIDNMLKS